MAVDLPPGTWTAALIGPWWPAPSTALRAGAQHWGEACVEQQLYSQTLRSQWTSFAAHNQGHTADDLIDRFQQGEKFHLDLAEKYQAKASAFNSAADATDYLRSRLSDIANTGNKEINETLASKKLPPEKLAEIQAVQTRCNADAANASRDAVDKMMGATQKILNAEGVGGDARAWARANGFNLDDASAPSQLTGVDLHSPGGALTGSPAVGGGGGHGGQGSGSSGPAAPPPAVSGLQGHGTLPPGGGGAAGPAQGGGAVSGLQGHGAQFPGASPAVSPAGSVSPGGTGTVSPGMPGVQGGGMPISPAGLGQGPQPNLAQSFTSGLATGQATGPGGQAFSAGTLNALDSGAPQTPQATPAVTPTVPSAGAFIAGTPPVDAPPATASAPSTTGGATPVAPAVMTGGSWSSPAATVGGGPSVPSGSLPAYGSDLRPPVVASPSMPSVPAGPVSGAPVAPSSASSPSAGGPLVSPVERSASAAAAGQAGAGSSAMASASAASAATGATAGAASARAAEQQRLQRLVDAVARQEPRLSWAAGLRDDGTTTLLVTDLAGGWIPPHVRLPAHVTLLEPTARRHDANVIDLLGAITVAAAHHANTYVAEPGSDAPALSGDRPARSAAPQVDELGPTLVEAVRRRDGLPRIAQAVAAPAVRKTGVLDSESELLRECVTEIQHEVLASYPNHDPASVGDWMLLAAIEALIDGQEYLTNYHMSWFDAISHRGGS
ncbi:MAG: hypothetical protein EPN51_05585 [Mycobacterium sp.]|nr:DUF5631 domain-containing protein [Mycobacterium sp.]TAM71805.1 MAG: hypothetical protein EPN51_05585 [Mycobacterium sp.]